MQTATQVQIKASELRIGNWIYYNPALFVQRVTIPAQAIRITGITKDALLFQPNHYIKKDVEEGNLPINYCTPIEITPQLLEKCGFEKDHNNYYSIGEGSYLFEAHGKWWIAGVNEDGPGLDYLHQLQNLYSAIYLKELQINL